jgi:agmatine deiminase
MAQVSTPRQDGFVMPGEFEPHEGCWIAWPTRADNFKENCRPAQVAFTNVIKVISTSELVTVTVAPSDFVHVSRLFQDNRNVRVVELTTDDNWWRDFGPCFVVNRTSKEVRGVHFNFNNWGKGGTNYERDRVAGWKLLNLEKKIRYHCPMVLEGGSIHVDGEGTLITTEECLLNPNRNPHLSRSDIERMLCDYLGIEKVIWLGKGVYRDDDTNGHIDNLCCFVRPGVVALTWTDNTSDPQHAISLDAFQRLSEATDARGRTFQIHTVHQPTPLYYTEQDVESLAYTFDDLFPRNPGWRLPASYINFYIGNKVVVAPAFGDPKYDAEAKEKLQKLFPERVVHMIYSRNILLGGGNIHCITLQQPKVL